MKVFGVLVALSIIQSAAALPGGGADYIAEGSSSAVNPVLPGQPADGDSSAGAANENIDTCTGIEGILKLNENLRGFWTAEYVTEANRNEMVRILEHLSNEIDLCMNTEKLTAQEEAVLEDTKQQIQTFYSIRQTLEPNVPE
jgi:hypothetical protein